MSKTEESLLDDSSTFDFDDMIETMTEEELASTVQDDSAEVTKSIDFEHLAFSKTDLSSVLGLCKEIQTGGANIYDSSILISASGDTSSLEFEFCYTSFGVFFRTVLRANSPSPENLFTRKVLVNINSLVTVLKYAGNNVILAVDDRGLTANVLGGSVPLLVHMAVDESPYKSPRAEVDREREMYTIDSIQLQNALKIAELGRQCTSAQQRLLYLSEERAYSHTGGISAAVDSVVMPMTIQPKGITALTKFIKNAPSNLQVGESETHLVFQFDNSLILINKVPDELPKPVVDMFNINQKEKSSSPASLPILVGIADVLSVSSQTSGVLMFTLFDDGVQVESKDKSGKRGSKFSTGSCTNKLNGKSLSVSFNAVKKALPLMKGNPSINVMIQNSLLYFYTDIVTIAVSGNKN